MLLDHPTPLCLRKFEQPPFYVGRNSIGRSVSTEAWPVMQAGRCHQAAVEAI